MMTIQNQKQDQSRPDLKPAGEVNPEFAKAVSEYLQRFNHVFHLDKWKMDRIEVYEWCSKHLGEKYKDWFMHEGGAHDKVWALSVRDSKNVTMFMIKYNDIIKKYFNKDEIDGRTKNDT